MDWHNHNVLITGADGFIGGWLAKALVEKKANVIVIIRDERKNSALALHNLKDKVSILRGSVTDYDFMRRAVNEYHIHYCFHLAAQAIVGVANRSPLSTFDTNIRGTWTTLEAIRDVDFKELKGIIVASTDKAYGVHEMLPYTEQSELRGSYPYDVSKVCADVLARCYATMYNLPVVVTRKANIYGGGDLNFSRIIPETIRCIITGESLLIRSDGTPQRDYLYVEDAVEGYLNLAEQLHGKGIRGHAFNFSSGNPVSVLEIVNTIIKIYGTPIIPKILGEARGEINVQYLSNEKAQRVLGWKPRHTLEEGMIKTIGWYKKYFANGQGT